jgi:regulator of replication initiation timing
MAGEQEIIVQDLIDRVHLLMEKYSELKKQNSLLRIENSDLSSQLEDQKEKIENIEQQYKTAKIAENILAPIDDKEEARGQLNRIVREIDNCIALLNI